MFCVDDISCILLIGFIDDTASSSSRDSMVLRDIMGLSFVNFDMDDVGSIMDSIDSNGYTLNELAQWSGYVIKVEPKDDSVEAAVKYEQ